MTSAPTGPAALHQARFAQAALIPFVLPQNLFQGGRTQQKMGQGLAVQIGFASANTDYTVTHNLGRPVTMVWAVMAPTSVYIPQVRISSTASSNTSKQVILQANAIANPTTVVLF
jgi:hypothetical protein